MNSPTAFIRRHIAGVIIVSMIAFVIVGGAILLPKNQKPKPQNLGPQLEYIGKKNVGGCILWWCEVQPYSEYYFATDMSPDELSKYFPKATLARSERQDYPLTDKTLSGTQFGFKLTNEDNGFSLMLYDDTDYILKTYRLKKTGKPYVVEILDSSYPLARDAL